MSSPEEARAAARHATDLPRPLPAMWRLCRLGFRHEPRLMAAAVGMAVLEALPDALVALWIALLGRGVVDGDRTAVVVAALGLAASSAGTWFLRTVSARVQRRFRDRVTIALEAHVARLQATVATIAHQERPDLLDRLSVLRDQVFVLDHMYLSVFATGGWIVRVGVTVALLASVHPALLLLAVFALPTALTAAWRPAVERAAEERGAPSRRLATHLFTTATTAAPAKELRVTGAGDRVARQRREAWEDWYRPVAAARLGTAVWSSLSWAVFGLAYVGAVVTVAAALDGTAEEVLLVVAAGARLSGYIGATVGEIGFLRGIWMDGAQRLAWLEDYAAEASAAGTEPPPDRLTEGIRLEGVTFAYPGTDRAVLRDVDLTLPAGAVVAVVGENGAGKTSLVKLLAKLYAPTDGRILVDGVDLAALETEAWRARMAGAFQDFFRFELVARQSVGVGDLSRHDDPEPVQGAVEQAGATDVVARLPQALDTQLGPTWPEGVDLSHGQWQKLAVARGFMRAAPLVLVLDEPTAALDAETEHMLFARYAEAARAGRHEGRITILVSHRFSTVAMADLIVVLDGGRLVEVGSHEELVAAGGTYAELYGLQAAAYRT